MIRFWICNTARAAVPAVLKARAATIKVASTSATAKNVFVAAGFMPAVLKASAATIKVAPTSATAKNVFVAAGFMPAVLKAKARTHKGCGYEGKNKKENIETKQERRDEKHTTVF
jgi:hypothetical protein